MTTRLNPYLAFQGPAREAMEFYQSVFGGELNVMTFGDMGGMGMPEESHGLVMHSDLMVNDGVTLMGSDQPGDDAPVNGSVSLSGDDDATLRAWWAGLAEGGEVTLPLEVAPWGDAFGQLTDKFGIAWMFNIAGTPAA
ncbi:VOC family protein [Nocardioides sp.]|uniref:VOC family protein n=1 Tax=Nocardioides sp. TaxID=35761 RepID=UPI002721D59E|nr:VOC family protein [Nocardioides sp.]MDO9456801.1 VOC family protein [Nocardioides sp.]